MKFCGRFKSFSIFLVFLVIPYNSYAFSAIDFKKFLPDQIGDFSATADVSTEDLNEGNGIFHRAQRFYKSKNGALCILAFVKGAGVQETIAETFAKGNKIKIKNFNAVQIPPNNNIVASSVKLDNDFLITAVVLNSEEKEVPINILKKLDLIIISKLNKNSEAYATHNLQATELLPPFTNTLSGKNEVRIKNPNEYKVFVGLRTGKLGKNFEVAPNGITSVKVPNGKYKIYFVYSNKPKALFQGDDFSLDNNGIEIQIVKIVGGNYGIKQVK